ncbi:nesprin-3 [Nelusetta ayraudi]|uniref:nesprin-3 n=1 Tax=Nelusetta ayraudi TaxID=303726 RepID=UPI003F70A148
MLEEFKENQQLALSWMEEVQRQLKANDCTEGPRDRLEARLRDTKRIHQSQHDGRVKMEMVLASAENLLRSEDGDEELKNQTQARLKVLKRLWEETCTYIVHCHSRIEWVWLHWSEFLKAHEEFEGWLSKQRSTLDVGTELQLGLKEKVWQVDQQRVVVSDVHSQSLLLERLLDEAAALHSRTQDPSVGAEAQEQLQEAYNTIRDRSEERLLLLQKMVEEHQTFQSRTQKFQSWLRLKTKDLADLMEKKNSAEDKLEALRALDETVANEEKTLVHIEGLAEALRGSTSPAGAALVAEEAEELRLGWQGLRLGLTGAQQDLHTILDTHSQYLGRCKGLREDIRRLREKMQELHHQLEDTQGAGRATEEEQLVGHWKRYTAVKNSLAEQETQVELIKVQLKDLFRFSEDSQYISDDVVAVVREHQSLKCRATKLCCECESELRNVLQDPLLAQAQWSYKVSEVLASSSDVTDFPHVAVMVQTIERLLKDSVQVQEGLLGLQEKVDLMDSVFDSETSGHLQDELCAAVRNRELLHTQLLQRKSRLEGLMSRTKDFTEAFELVFSKLAGLQERLVAADGLQPDILAKKSQSDQFKVILKDLQDCEAQVVALEALVSSSDSNNSQLQRLHSGLTQLHTTVVLKERESEENIESHESFHDNLLKMEQWLMIIKQKFESFHSLHEKWMVEGREHEAERVLAEFEETELQLHQMEVQGQKVLEKTSAEGQVHIVRDLERLRESWTALRNTSSSLDRLLNTTSDVTDSASLTNQSLPPGKMSLPTGVAEGEENEKGATNLQVWKEPVFKVDRSTKLFGTSEASGTETGGISTKEGSRGQVMSRWREFEAWLLRESRLLSEVLGKGASEPDAKEFKIRQEKLKALRSRAAWGQEQFQLLLQSRTSSQAEGSQEAQEDLEDLRYRWMLHKSKLKEVTQVRKRTKAKKVGAKAEELLVPSKVQKRPSLLRRVCRLALPLWLLLLALLLLLLLLLPFVDQAHSCSCHNNFARSFNIMLRYQGPPPT